MPSDYLERFKMEMWEARKRGLIVDPVMPHSIGLLRASQFKHLHTPKEWRAYLRNNRTTWDETVKSFTPDPTYKGPTAKEAADKWHRDPWTDMLMNREQAKVVEYEWKKMFLPGYK